MTNQLIRISLNTCSILSKSKPTSGRLGPLVKEQRRLLSREMQQFQTQLSFSQGLLTHARLCLFSPLLRLFLCVKLSLSAIHSGLTSPQLPLSFMASFFALGVQQFPRDPKSGNTSWPLRYICGLLCKFIIALRKLHTLTRSSWYLIWRVHPIRSISIQYQFGHNTMGQSVAYMDQTIGDNIAQAIEDVSLGVDTENRL